MFARRTEIGGRDRGPLSLRQQLIPGPGAWRAAFGVLCAGRLNEADYDGYRPFELDDFLSISPRAVDERILLLDATPDTTAHFRVPVEYEQKGPGLGEYEYTTDPVVLVAD